MKKQNDWWGMITLFLLVIAIFIGAWNNNLLLTAAGIVGIIFLFHLELSKEIDELENSIKQTRRNKNGKYKRRSTGI